MAVVSTGTPTSLPAVRVITMDRPDRLNAMSMELVGRLADAFRQVSNDNECAVVILTGANGAFCSGLDLKDHGDIPNIDGLTLPRIAPVAMEQYSVLTPLMRRVRQPMIAAIEGAAYGGGMCLALGCDIRIASTSARFNATGIVNGLTSTELGASWLLPRLIGASAAFDLLLTGRVVEADEARSMGLVSKVVEKDEALAHALSLAGQMCRFSTYGLQQTKAVLWANLETAGLEGAIALEDRAQLLLGFTDNLPEAIRARQQGRAPVYTDEPRTS